MGKTFFFYDLETSGLDRHADRIMQFAGQRTDMDLNPVGEPVNILVKMTDDALPSPKAIMVTKITPQKTLAEGISEAEFCRVAMDEIFVPNTVAVGYNTVRFDDEFMRAILWRNFYDPYEWEWKDGRSRWDMLDVVRLTRALRPEGINWPVTDEGKATNRLELLTKMNGLSHEHAHDALSDVYATIAVATLIREKQPDLFSYLFKMRDKREVQKLINLDNPRPFVYASGRYSSEHEKTTVAVPIAPGRNGNVLVYDLRYDVEEELGRRDKAMFPIVKELCYNKCPAVAPMSVLDKDDGWEKIGLTREGVERNLAKLLQHPEFAEQMRLENESRPEFPPVSEPELALYDGFLDETDRIKVAAVRNADVNRLADFHPDFHDARLPGLLLHYKGRNFPEALSEKEMEEWERYRQDRLKRQSTKFMEELKEVYTRDEFVAEELRLYFESLWTAD
ncbi:exodeoxyribonuclease I [Candidatus Saccharibacteria bacterium]|nr:exodeoxyribonuclease I [Candidatus Saccharibacteria bacterium]